MTRRDSARITPAMVLVALLLVAGNAAASPTTIGTIDNFDVYNNTGQVGRGFEIELESVSSADVLYTFGAPYTRFGDPVVVPIPTGVIVRYASPFSGGGFLAGTVVPTSAPTATGHDCYSGGPIGNYDGSGCEHFGVSLAKAAAKTTYRWLVADPNTPGGLITDTGTVSLPAPVVTVTPNVNNPAAPPQVDAGVQAPPPPPANGGEPQWGEALWVKVFKTETQDQIDLNDLLNGAPVIEATETEIEWKLLQSPPVGEVAESEELNGDGGIAGGDGAVVRRYEFYAYIGEYDPETHEAKFDNPNNAGCSPSCIGDLIGAQMVGVNFVGFEPVVGAAPVEPPVGNDVPSPATLLLLAPALGMLAASRRRR